MIRNLAVLLAAVLCSAALLPSFVEGNYGCPPPHLEGGCRTVESKPSCEGYSQCVFSETTNPDCNNCRCAGGTMMCTYTSGIPKNNNETDADIEVHSGEEASGDGSGGAALATSSFGAALAVSAGATVFGLL